MFVEDASFETACLRQGDILRDIPVPLIDQITELVGLANVNPSASYFTPPKAELATTHRNDSNWFKASGVKVRLSYCAVLSNCCELEKFRTPCLSVARLMPIDEGILSNPTNLAILRANVDPRVGKQYMRQFYIPPHERLEGKEWVVDFSQITSLPKSEFKET